MRNRDGNQWFGLPKAASGPATTLASRKERESGQCDAREPPTGKIIATKFWNATAEFFSPRPGRSAGEKTQPAARHVQLVRGRIALKTDRGPVSRMAAGTHKRGERSLTALFRRLYLFS